MRARMLEAARAKARHGELRIPVPPGYIWDREAGLDLDPDERLHATIREISHHDCRAAVKNPERGDALLEIARMELDLAEERDAE